MKDDDDSNINLQNITSGEKPISDEVKNFFEDQEYNNIKLLKHSEDKKIKEESKEIKNISININNTNEIPYSSMTFDLPLFSETLLCSHLAIPEK